MLSKPPLLPAKMVSLFLEPVLLAATVSHIVYCTTRGEMPPDYREDLYLHHTLMTRA